MKQNKDLEKYFSKELFEINDLLNKIETMEYEVEYGDSHFICDIHGICEVEKDDDEGSYNIGSCCFCGTELRRVNGEWYHYSAFDDEWNLIDENYQTHGYNGFQHGEPTTEEERELFDLRKKLEKYEHIKNKSFALFGNPIKHSASPSIYKQLFNEENVIASYDLFEVDTVREIKEKLIGLDGANITYPFKEDVINILDELYDYSFLTKSVNMIKKIDGKLIGFNTDGLGFANTIKEHNQKILIIGSGSTAKVSALCLRNIAHDVTITNRSKNGRDFFIENGFDFYLNEDLPIEKYDIIVNMTSAGLNDLNFPMNKEKLIELVKLSSKGIDVIYNKTTPFLNLFKEFDKEYEDGKKMLKSQAIENMKIWYRE